MTPRFFGICSIAILLLGCSVQQKITGTVKFDDGTPLTQGSVIFESDSEKFFGFLDTNGNFSMGTEKSGDGIKAGSYKVRLAGTEITEYTESGDSIVTKLVPDKYTNTFTSGWTAEVGSGKPKTFDYVIEKSAE